MKATASAATTRSRTWLWRVWLLGACVWVVYGFVEVSGHTAPRRSTQQQVLFTADSCGTMGDRLAVRTCIGLQQRAAARAVPDDGALWESEGAGDIVFLFGPPLAVLAVFFGFLRLFRWGFS